MPPSEVAKAVGVPEAELREVNRIPPRMRVLAGSTLLVPRPASHEDDVGAHVADHAQLAFAPEGRGQRRVSVRIGHQGESVASVARRHRVSAVQVARWNGVSPRGHFRAGQTVVVMVSAPAPGKARASRAGQPTRAAATRKAVKPTPKAAANRQAGAGRAAAPR
jgi:membrane-bound lytic murein transglycosylase D